MTIEVVVTPTAEADLTELTEWVADNAGVETALAYVGRVEARFAQLREFPDRGALRPDFGKGIRGLSFERRLLILYHVERSVVRVFRVLSARRDLRDLRL